MGLEAQEQDYQDNEISRTADKSLAARGYGEMMQQAANNNNAFSGEKGEVIKIIRQIDTLQSANNNDHYEINELKERALDGKMSSKELESQVKKTILRQAEKALKETVDPDEDNVLNHSKGWLKYMEGRDLKDLAGEMKHMKESNKEQLKHKKKLEDLKEKSPRAFKAYLKALKQEMGRSSMSRTKSEILEDTKKTFDKAIKAPSAVQGEFFPKAEKGEIAKDSFEKTLEKLEQEYEAKIAKYTKLVDENEGIFGKKPANEFRKWITERKSFAEIDEAQFILESKYIPERKEVQKEFEDMPEAMTKEHKEKWENDLGYSERKMLLQSLHQLEKQKDNPLAQEYMKTLTDSPREVAGKEWPKMMENFLKHDAADQETLLKAYKLTEGKERKEIADRFEDLPKNIQESNKDFFNMDKEEKTILLRALEKDNKGENSADAWGDVMETDQGKTIFADKLRILLENNKTAKDIQMMDVLAGKTLKDQMISGETKSENRQLRRVKAKGGEDAAEKVEKLQDLTDGEVTIDARTAKERQFHTMDLTKLGRGGMETNEMDTIRRELTDEGLTNDERDYYSRAKFVMKDDGPEINLAQNVDQRNNITNLVQEQLIMALMMAVEAMSGRKVASANDNRAFEEMAKERSKEMLGQWTEMTRHRFKGLTGLSEQARKAA
ncbi:MAG: hypothetical protein ACD_51C00226G0010 [uncultured bacterium]|nr:MAG: hypothetical protein ACD_51C00226G0010 [uncultured bacterium]OGJ48610.1 MAG: hypothetical protein A2344_04895 [Candidatus Peregrinibacteria bacterium RIFOXYB12_FULL_41_12]OGJ48701.1 MAG: hypothetical protein A2244_03320 [Candidatus Peregrinibacteria bacterium RIFOXYA2_FULL_41_18]